MFDEGIWNSKEIFMSFEDKKIQKFKWVISSCYNEDHSLKKAIKIQKMLNDSSVAPYTDGQDK